MNIVDNNIIIIGINRLGYNLKSVTSFFLNREVIYLIFSTVYFISSITESPIDSSYRSTASHYSLLYCYGLAYSFYGLIITYSMLLGYSKEID